MLADIICFCKMISGMALDGITSFLRLKDVTNTVVLRLKVTPLCTRNAQGLSLVSTTSSQASSLE